MKQNYKHPIKALSLALALVACLGAFASCGKKEEIAPPQMAEELLQFDISQRARDIKAQSKNEDVVGWIYIPTLEIDDPVVYSKDNNNYQRNKLDGSWDYFGEYFVDMDNIGAIEGTRDSLDKQTVLYGHNVYNGKKNKTYWQGHVIPDYSVDKVPVDFENGEKFARLFQLKDKEIAEKTPYIYFSTDDEEMAWEIFAVYYTDINSFSRWNGYETMSTDKGMMNVVSDSIAKSIFDYGVSVSESDKILTLSTCSYIEGADNHDLRFHVCARLVKEGEEFKESLSLKENEKRIDMREKALLYPVSPASR